MMYIYTPDPQNDGILPMKKKVTKQYKNGVSFFHIVYLLISISQEPLFPQNFLECLLKYISNIAQDYWTIVSGKVPVLFCFLSPPRSQVTLDIKIN